MEWNIYNLQWHFLCTTMLFSLFPLFLFFKYSSIFLYSLRAENIIVAQKIIGTLLMLALWDCFSFSFKRYSLARLLLKPKQNQKKGTICILKVDCWDGNSCIPLTERGLTRSNQNIIDNIFFKWQWNTKSVIMLILFRYNYTMFTSKTPVLLDFQKCH